jgi:predicted ATPase/DNA-binding CsgD family transcriptional regulator
MIESATGGRVASASLRLEPPLRSSQNLPRELGSFVGREHELDELTRRLAEAPLVTVAGPGGAGKTRLALHLAHRTVETGGYPDRVVLVELAALTEPRQVPQALAASLAVPERRGQPVLQALVNVLRPRELLVVLDNCEHLVQMCAEVVRELLGACPLLRVLATSREPLGVAGEVVFRVPPLQLPPDNRLESLAQSEAGRLFVQRAQGARADFMLDDSNAPAVAELCRRLDGLPLAIELAAARVAGLSTDDISRRLGGALRIAADGPRSAPPRQRTLQATITWSIDLLEPSERTVFRRLAVFGGGFTVEGAQALADDGLDVLDVLPRLVAKSMVQADPQATGGLRYRLLEPLREYAHAGLATVGEVEGTRRRHAEYVLTLAQRLGSERDPPSRLAWARELNAEADNIRLAHEWAVESQDAELAVRLAATLWRWWSRPDRQAAGRVWLERILAMPGTEPRPMLRAHVVVGLGFLSMLQGDLSEAARRGAEARQLAAATANPAIACIASSVEGSALALQGAAHADESLLWEAIASARTAGLSWVEMLSLAALSMVALARGDLAAADSHIRQSLRGSGGQDAWARAIALNSLGDVLRARGEVEQAGAAYHEALLLFRSLDPQQRQVPQGLLHNLGYVALAHGDVARAARLLLESADSYRTVGDDRRGLAECAIGLACTAVRARRLALAARLFGSAEAELARLQTQPIPANRAEYERGLARLEGSMEPGRLEAARSGGGQLSLEDALIEARALAREPGESRPPRPPAGLTGREYEVAVLLARGRSNRQVAQALVITEKTAKNHVQQVLQKLGVQSRAEVSARARELGVSTEGALAAQKA